MREQLRHRPVKRSKARLVAGKYWFTWKRYLDWIPASVKLAKERTEVPLPHAIFDHATPLVRNLRNVDMWLHTNKVINLRLAAERLNGLLLKPGETFSYWRTIGKPSKRKGYVDGMVLQFGGFKTGIGGGLCQMSNLIYWMTLHTPLTVTERHRHSYDVFPDAGRSQPFGSGATCVYNYLDLQITNMTSNTYQLCVRLTESQLVGEWRCTVQASNRYEIYEKNHQMSAQPWGGYIRSNVIHRKRYNAENELIDDEYVTENHALMMYAPLLDDQG